MLRTRGGGRRAVGDFLIFLTHASRDLMPQINRQRYVTVGALMPLTAAQAFYSATAIASREDLAALLPSLP